jgi:ubiquinone/menaquinone biosynthesis C-methylase UbiE
MRSRVVIFLAVTGAFGAAALRLRAFWLREREAKTVFPAKDAPALLNPLRRVLQDPRAIVADAAIAPGERVLELGPGPGYFTLEAARAAGERGCVIAADLQQGMLSALRTRLQPPFDGRVRAVAADATRLPLVAGSIDRVFLSAVLGEVPDARAAVREIARVLRPGGTVTFCETLTDPDYMRQSDLRALCADAGLEVEAHRRGLLGYTLRFVRPT